MDENSRSWERIQENWAQLQGAVKARWERLPDERLGEINGSREALLGELQQAYGLSREEAAAQLDAFVKENEDYFDRVRDTSASTPLSPRP